MILGSIRKSGLEVKSLPAAIQKAIKYVSETDFSKLGNKKHSIDGDKMFVIISEYKTKPKEECKSESHKKYLDVQFMISGQENMGLAYDHPTNEILEDYNEEKERWLYKKLYNEIAIPVLEGMYVVFFPTDLHRPSCNLNGEQSVRKAVVKISIDLL